MSPPVPAPPSEVDALEHPHPRFLRVRLHELVGRWRALPSLVRRVAYVGLVLVLGLVLAVGVNIRSAQEAKANPALLAPFAPVMVAAGPPGWIVGGSVMLGAVVLSESIRRDAEDGEMFWEGSGDRWRDLINGTKNMFSNQDENKDGETSVGVPFDGVPVKPEAFRLSNFRETTSSGGNRQLTIDVTLDKMLPKGSGYWAVDAMIHKTCRNADGTTHPEILRQSLGQQSRNSQQDVAWTPKIHSTACAKGKIVGVQYLPMTQADWDTKGTGYPRSGAGYYWDFTVPRVDFYYFPEMWEGSTGYKTKVTCVRPDGTEFVVESTSTDAEGLEVPGCVEDGGGYNRVDNLVVDRMWPGGGSQEVAQADVTGSRPIGISVDGVACVQGREGCANWSELAGSSPERVQCTSEGRTIALSHCNLLERFYENGGTSIHPDNVDGNPATYYDPWQDPAFTGVYQKPDGTFAPAPTRPTERPPVTSPEPWAPEIPEVDPYTDPSSPLYDPTLDPDAPEYDPRKDPANPEYDPFRDPRSPHYNPAMDPAHPDYRPESDPEHPDYDPYKDPTSPLYDPDGPDPEPDPDPDPNPDPEPEPDPDPNPDPEPEPDPDPNPDPEPEPEPGEEPAEGEEPAPDPDAPEDPEPELQPGEQPPPLPPLPTAVGVDEYGHLLPISAALATSTAVLPSGTRVFTDLATGVRTELGTTGTRITTVEAVPGLKTVHAVDGTRTTTRVDAPPLVTRPPIGRVPGTGIRTKPPKFKPPTTTCVVGSLDPRCYDDDDDDDDPNCWSESWSFNPTDFVYEPVVCAIMTTFYPDEDVLAYVGDKLRNDSGLAKVDGVERAITTFRDEVDDLAPASDSCAGPAWNLALPGFSETVHPFSACGRMAPAADAARAVSSLIIVLAGGLACIRNVARGFDYEMHTPEVDGK